MASSSDIEKSAETSKDGDRHDHSPSQPHNVDEIPDEPLSAGEGHKVKNSGTMFTLIERINHTFRLRSSPESSPSSSPSNFLSNIPSFLPKNRKKRRLAIILIIITMVSILALILGLSIGLTHKTSAFPHPHPGLGGNAPSGTFSGDMTYYSPSVGLGACGFQFEDDQPIVALGAQLFDEYTPNGNPNLNSLCGQLIRVFYNGKSQDLQVTDRCPECDYGSIDVSPSAFGSLANVSTGRVLVSWVFIT